MNTEDKSFALAELEYGRIIPTFEPPYFRLDNYEAFCAELYRPYDEDEAGRAKFAAILLKHPEVMIIFTEDYFIDGLNHFRKYPTQENILDEILRMNGKIT